MSVEERLERLKGVIEEEDPEGAANETTRQNEAPIIENVTKLGGSESESYKISEDDEEGKEDSEGFSDDSEERRALEEMRSMGYRMGYEQEIKKHREILMTQW